MKKTARYAPLLAVWACMLGSAGTLAAQQVLQTPERVITVAKGKSALIVEPSPYQRVNIAEPDIANFDLASPREIVLRGIKIGTTTLFVWRPGGAVSLYTIEVTADGELIQRQLGLLFPGADIQVTVTSNTVILTGSVTRPGIARRAEVVARNAAGEGANIVNNIQQPSAEQVLLKVRFAEVNRTAAQDFSSQLQALNPDRLQFDRNKLDWQVETVSDGLFHLFLLGENSSFEALINSLKSRGDFKSLAEPNLLALEGQEASFLAGGEFPFPVVQSSNSNAVTIQYREFGIRLNFTPTILDNGAIRLKVAPEVSSLDFTNGLILSGFRIPTILSRKASTVVELKEGQHLAIAGLLDNSIKTSISKLPLLGDLPILGAFFRSTSTQQARNELLVIVTPYLVEPSDTPPPLPTGEPGTWKWMRGLRPEDIKR